SIRAAHYRHRRHRRSHGRPHLPIPNAPPQGPTRKQRRSQEGPRHTQAACWTSLGFVNSGAHTYPVPQPQPRSPKDRMRKRPRGQVSTEVVSYFLLSTYSLGSSPLNGKGKPGSETPEEN